jgi:type IV fimbrial biogenesis protein FimT
MHDPVNHLLPHWHCWTPPLTHGAACPGRRPALGGFTLIELLVTIVVLSILLVLAVPSFRSFMQNDQQWTQTNNLILSLNAARSEAIKNDTTVFPAILGSPGSQICTSNDGVACTGTPWNQGWIVLGADPANPQNPKTLQVVGPLPAGTTLTEASDNRSITFLSNGAVNTAPGALVNTTVPVAFKMCDARGAAFARYLQVTLMGRVVTAPTAGQNLSSPPAPLTCP